MKINNKKFRMSRRDRKNLRQNKHYLHQGIHYYQSQHYLACKVCLAVRGFRR